MKRVVVRAPAKVNLCLRVLGRRTDGFHEVETILHTVGLWDRLYLEPIPGESGIALSVDTAEVPADESNLCWQAADLLMKCAKDSGGVAIRLEKSIPAGAGIGGGSSDAAATLAGLAHMWGLTLARQELLELASEIGADVPFFLLGGCCLARGKGEKLQALPAIAAWVVLVVPERRVSTAHAYAALGRGTSRGRPKSLTRAAQRVVKATRAGDLPALAKALHNDFEAIDMAGIAEAREAKAALIEAGCSGALLSGSGSAVFGIAPGEEAANGIAAKLRDRWPWVEAVSTVPSMESLLIQEAAEA